MDKFEAMRVFCKVVEHGSFAAAADKLGQSTSAVSRWVAQLESHLQARLLNRTTRRISLTESGSAYVAEVIGHFSLQRFFNQQFGQLLEQPVFANQVFRLLVISQQAVQQFLGYGFLCYGHHRSWQYGSFLPGDRLHKNSYTLELVAYLRSRGRFAVLEASFRQLHSPTAWRPRGADRHIDILVLDEKHIPLVTIELKHYSPHQGKIDPLCAGLESDYDKLPRPTHGGKSVPLIQVGIHTEIIEIRRNPVNAPFSLQDFEFYRFLLAYVFKGSNGEAVMPTNIVPYADFKTNSEDFDSWLAGLEGNRYLPLTKGICQGPTEHFVIPASHSGNYEITGRINFFVGLAV